ncbi:SDR family NAD(P)-dependent oxidoreductase, partial [Staphylococcus hominis]
MTRTVLVTGSSRGLGAVIAKTLATQGFEVIINYNQSREAAEALAKELGDKAIAIQADVT